MNPMQRSFAATMVAFGLSSTIAIAKDGAKIYQDVCGRCHGLLQEQSWQRFLPKDGAPIELAVVLPQGPTLNGIVGRPVGIIDGYSYSKAMRAFAETGAIWDRETLDKFLTDSRQFVKGTIMIVKLAEDDRASVLGYLEQVARYQQ